MRLLCVLLLNLSIGFVLAPQTSLFAQATEKPHRSELIRNLFDQYTQLATSLGDDPSEMNLHRGKCGFPAVLQLEALRERYGKIAGYDDIAVRPSDSDFPETFDSPGGYFKIHYTTRAGDRDAIDESYGDHNLNGVPDYVDITAMIADSVWEHHIDQLGYIEPRSDETLGGDSRYDIYIDDLDPSYYGITWNDPTTLRSQSSWLELDNHYENYQGYSDRPLDALRVTLAHEFTHALHLTYDASEYLDGPGDTQAEDVYWFEMHATWMEEATYDYINDYYYYLPSYMAFVHKSPQFIDNSGLSIYGACLFPLFLSEKFGPDVNRIAWENCAAVPYENFFISAIQDAITEVSNGTASFKDVWVEYTQWLYFTGSRARAGFGFQEAANYSEIPRTLGTLQRAYIHEWTQYPITAQQSRDNAFPPSQLGANYHDFRTASLDSTFGMAFTGVVSANPPIDWRISVLGYDRFNTNKPIWNPGTIYANKEPINITNLTGLTDILVIPTIANPEAARLEQSSFAYQFIVADSSISALDDQVRYGPSKFRLSEAATTPFTVFVQVSDLQDVEIAFFNVAGEAVYTRSYELSPGDGERSLIWDGRNDDGEEVASGIYILQVRIGDDVSHHKILVL